jgi:hypothetical protein
MFVALKAVIIKFLFILYFHFVCKSGSCFDSLKGIRGHRNAQISERLIILIYFLKKEGKKGAAVGLFSQC